jgi:hypothetical protein
MAGFNFNPLPTTVGQGLFDGASSLGVTQGTAYPAPNAMWNLRGGVLKSDETQPMWGGVGVFMDIPAYGRTGPDPRLGLVMGRSTGLTGSKKLQGFSVFDQNYSAINWPQSGVPTSLPGMQVNAYYFGSGARLALQADPTLIDLWGQPISSQVAWDFVNQRVIPYLAAGAIAATGSSYNSTTGLATLVLSAASGLGVGDSVEISGVTGTGGDLGDLDGTFTTEVGTGGTTVVVQLATGLTISSITGGAVTTGSPLTGVTILDVQPDNCMTVDYDNVAGTANWDYDGACVVLQI